MNRNRNVYLMYLIVFLQGFVFYGPIATLYRQAKGLSMYDIFLIESISWIMMILLEIPWGWFADRFGYKKTIVISNLIFFLSKIVFYKADCFGMFLLERVLLSFALAGLSGCDVALLYSSVEEKDAERVFGIYSACTTCGFLTASLLYTFIISASMEMAGFLTIIPYGAAFVLCIFLKDAKVSRDQRSKLGNSFRAVLKNRPVIMFVLSIALAREVVQSITVFLNQLQYTKSGIDIKYYGILIAAAQIARLTSVKAYRLSVRIGKYKSILLLYTLISIGCTALIFTSSPILSISCILVISLCMALLEPMAMDVENKSISTKDRATILSIYAMIGNISAAAINPIIGKAADVSIEAALRVCILICVGMITLFYLSVKNNSLTDKSLKLSVQ